MSAHDKYELPPLPAARQSEYISDYYTDYDMEDYAESAVQKYKNEINDGSAGKAIARLRGLLNKASFATNSDRQSALDCLDAINSTAIEADRKRRGESLNTCTYPKCMDTGRACHGGCSRAAPLAPQPAESIPSNSTGLGEAAEPVKVPSDAEIDAVFNAMLDGVDGWLKSWGYRQFARALLARYGHAAIEAALQSQDREDAERYRALVASGKFVPATLSPSCLWGLRASGTKATKAELDAAIDHARRVEGKS